MAGIARVRLQNPGILKWAREELGLTPNEVAEHMKRMPEEISGWEEGSLFPTFRQLEALAKYYGLSSSSFFLPTTPPPSAKPSDFRTLPDERVGTYGRETLLAYRETEIMLRETRELLDALNIELKYSLPTWHLDDDADLAASEIRNLLGISVEQQSRDFRTYLAAQDAWRSALFDRGIIVRICQMPIEDARAFSLSKNQLGGIGLSNEDREHGRIFSLFHEVCHLGLGKNGVSGMASRRKSGSYEIEQYCDQFSAAFLLPRSHTQVLKSLREFKASPDVETARKIANRFKVSKYVIARRALDLGVIREALYWKIVEDFRLFDSSVRTQPSGGGNYYATQISRLGKRFVTLALDALKREYLSPMEAQRMLGISAVTAESML